MNKTAWMEAGARRMMKQALATCNVIVPDGSSAAGNLKTLSRMAAAFDAPVEGVMGAWKGRSLVMEGVDADLIIGCVGAAATAWEEAKMWKKRTGRSHGEA